MSRTVPPVMAAFQVIINGRFWVITEGILSLLPTSHRLIFPQSKSSFRRLISVHLVEQAGERAWERPYPFLAAPADLREAAEVRDRGRHLSARVVAETAQRMGATRVAEETRPIRLLTAMTREVQAMRVRRSSRAPSTTPQVSPLVLGSTRTSEMGNGVARRH